MKALKIAGGAVAALLLVLIVNTLRVGPAPQAQPATDLVAVDAEAAIARLAGAVQIATVSYADRSKILGARLDQLAAHLQKSFPRVHAALKREIVNGHSLLFTWQGSDPAARPILTLAHQDVVPIEPGSESAWQHPPFSGEVAGGYVWGRGTLDDKSSLMSQLEAAELLLASGFKPRRTLYFAFGHDEEIGGEEGAAKVAEVLASRGIHCEYSLDEGGFIARGVVRGVERPVASIATAEKGYASFRLTAHDAGGHSSRPPAVTAIGRLARAVSQVEQNPLPERLSPPVASMLERLAPEYAFGRRVAVANQWLLGPLIARSLTHDRLTAALVRTTTAPTIFHAGIKDNVLPREAYAIVNFRILPGDTIASVEQHIREVVADPEIEIATEAFASEPSPVSDPAAPGFALLERTVNEVFPEAVVATGLVIGATDNRHYGAVRDNRYNFVPDVLTDEDIKTVHGVNERVGVDAYLRMVRFYARFLQGAAS